jgi:hypothetical protein
MSRLTLSAALCAALVLLASETARAAPCGITAAVIGDASPYKAKPPVGDFMTDRAARRGATKNVGQEITLLPLLQGTPAGTLGYRWFVEGEVIDDYQESPAEEPEGTAQPYAITDHAEVTESGTTGAVFTDPRITFYWRMQGIDLTPPVTVTITLQVTEAGADTTPCASATRQYTIERNTDDSENQPEDYYVEVNHGQRVLTEHGAWHASHRRPVNLGDVYQHGEMFAEFHHIFLANYDAFRTTFGYPRTRVYIPGTAQPDDENGYTVEHIRRNGPGATMIRPLWTTRVGGPPARAVGNFRCFRRDTGGQTSAGDFDGDLSAFGCAVENEWHNPIHGQIGGNGDMSLSTTAPKDPIFWRWHGFVDNVFDGFKALSSSLPHGHGARIAQAPSGPRCPGLRATMVGTSARDVLRGTRRRDVIAALGGNDVVRGLGGADVLCGGRGRDRLSGGRGNDIVDGGAGGDRVSGGSRADQVGGGAGDDRVFGGADSDQLVGGGGNDRLDGGKGSEWVIQGDGGNDRIEGGSGSDQMYGGAGRDRLMGQSDDDLLDGGSGNDNLDGGGGFDGVIYLQSPRGVDVDLGTGRATGYGSDRLDDLERVDGSRFADELTGGSGDEELNGHDGGDTLSGGEGEDVVIGGDGNDNVTAGGGDDVCVGEETSAGCEG